MERLINTLTLPCLEVTPNGGNQPLTAANPGATAVSPAALERRDQLLASMDDRVSEKMRQKLALGGLAQTLSLICEHSPFLTRLLETNPDFLEAAIALSANQTAQNIINEVAALDPDLSTPALMAALRKARARMALLAALADIGRLWGVTELCGWLSDFADICLNQAVNHVLRPLIREERLRLRSGAKCHEHGYAVLALGKLGGRELNYSSDIDLIVVFDSEKVTATGNRSIQDLFVRATQNLVKILQERSAEGFVFRVDLRLRPDPGATPVAISVNAAEAYYQSIGQPWERSAMIKARVIAGDQAAGMEFLDRMRPFIWRRNMDFAAIQDIHAMKQRIHEHHGFSRLTLPGHDAKIGLGGIREVEFFASIHQMIFGGRREDLQCRATMEVLARLAQSGDASEADILTLRRGYAFLRCVEHRLQMIDDQQTHRVPEAPEKLEALGHFLGFEKLSDFRQAYEAVILAIHEIYEDLLPEAREQDDPIDALEDYGFCDIASGNEILAGWRAGRYKALSAARAQALLRSFLPTLLKALGQAEDPDQALARFDRFLSQLPAGVQLFSLFQANPSLFRLMARIMAVAPALAEQLSQRPALLDAVLSTEFFGAQESVEQLRNQLDALFHQARDYQDQLDAARRWMNERRFQIGVLMLEGLLPPIEAAARLSDCADAIVASLLPHIIEEFAAGGAGIIPSAHFAVLAMGGFGARQLTYTSDLDLVFLYAVPDDLSQSDGPRPLAPSQYYSRLAQRIISALAALSGEGRLFEVDMRLRPSGRSGIIAVSLDAFLHYQQQEAWTWEHLALTKARLIAGDVGFAKKIQDGIEKILTQTHDWQKIQTDILDMRRRMDQEFGSKRRWSLKHAHGGLADIDFIIDGLTLRVAREDPSIVGLAFLPRLARLGAVKALNDKQLQEIAASQRLLFSTRALSRLMVGKTENLVTAPAAVGRRLAKNLGYSSLEALETAVISAKSRVVEVFASIYPP